MGRSVAQNQILMGWARVRGRLRHSSKCELGDGGMDGRSKIYL